MNGAFERCAGCGGPLYDTVAHCPYCGRDQSSAVPAALGAAKAVVDAGAAAAPLHASHALPAPAPVLQAEELAVAPAPPVRTPAKPVPPAEASAARPGPRVRALHLGIVGTVALLGAAGSIFLAHKPGPQDACGVVLAQAARLLTAGDPLGARMNTEMAMGACWGQPQARVTAMKAQVDAAITRQPVCERTFHRATGELAEHLLQSAQSTLDKLDIACVTSSLAKSLHQRINAGEAAADAAVTTTRSKLAQGDVNAARTALALVLASNSEHPDLAALQSEIQSGVKATEAATVIAPVAIRAAAPKATPRESVRAAATPAVVPVPSKSPAVNPQAELIHSFLRDAETSMNQLKFDAAKTYVESARRIDPGNPLAASLLRQIKERELRYMNEETSIK